jgi:hypothetical protein
MVWYPSYPLAWAAIVATRWWQLDRAAAPAWAQAELRVGPAGYGGHREVAWQSPVR